VANSDNIILFSDGAANTHCNASGTGVVIVDRGRLSKYIARELPLIGDQCQTNNQAEYEAIIDALAYVAHARAGGTTEPAIIFADSKLVVNQINRIFKVSTEHLRPLCNKARQLLDSMDGVEIKHVHREYNYYADFYSKLVINKVSERQLTKFQEEYTLREIPITEFSDVFLTLGHSSWTGTDENITST
jgi:ribonuclease HI